jgi:hypothetical protein
VLQILFETFFYAGMIVPRSQPDFPLHDPENDKWHLELLWRRPSKRRYSCSYNSFTCSSAMEDFVFRAMTRPTNFTFPVQILPTKPSISMVVFV